MIEIKYIAVVDDHVMVRKGLCSLINLFPSYEVVFDADNGNDMIEKLKSFPLPDIVLLDINMPKMDGYDSAQWLKVNYPQIQVLAVSTLDTEAAIIKMIRHGAKGYILKESDPKELKEAFDNVLCSGYHYNDAITQKLINSINGCISQDTFYESPTKVTTRELEFLSLACTEKTYQEIAKEMMVSERTVDGYRDSLFKKAGVTTRVGLVIYAIREHLIYV
ncbi:MAG TPA: response regulator transcription factor [Chitinophagaceae bacterium]|nr:response regulator transcription factor [Chitinophagaceae bacterium]